jgi:ComF family protein
MIHPPRFDRPGFDRLRSLAARLRSLAESPECALCGASGTRDGLCGGCHADLPWLPPDLCPRCAMTASGAATCGRCLAEPPPYDSIVAAVDYRFPVDAMIQRYKFAGELWLGPVLAAPLAARARGAPRPDALLPMPLAARRLVQRGFNPPGEVARILSRHAGIALRLDLLRRARDTPPQSTLPFAQRQANVRGAFVVDAPVQGLHLAVVDDVITTGATAAEAARTLLGQGAARVDIWAVARTLRHDR